MKIQYGRYLQSNTVNTNFNLDKQTTKSANHEKKFVRNCIEELNSKEKSTICFNEEQLELLKSKIDFQIEIEQVEYYIMVKKLNQKN
ncbi:MAG: hypothetical protein R3Y05_01195 [bacterium]